MVFAHFGTKTPRHLEHNIRRASWLFSNTPISLLVNPECKVPNGLGVEITRIPMNEDWIVLDSKLSHSKSFRENFWFTSLARFLALEKYSNLCQDEILHVESDVILSRDFPFSIFSKLDSLLAYPLVSTSQGIASILYLKNPEAAHLLVQTTLKSAESNSKTTDMLILKELYDSHREKIQLLPTAPTNSYFFRDFMTSEVLSNMDKGLEKFGGCFDGVDIGSYLTGIDPRNARGFRRLRSETNDYFLDVRKLKLIPSSERDFIDFETSGDESDIPLFSLHVHSKNLKWFSELISTRLLARTIKDFGKPPHAEFVPSVFVSSAFSAIVRKFRSIFQREK